MNQNVILKAKTTPKEIVFVSPIMIDDFPNYPFQVKQDEDMRKLIESIRYEGVLTPLVVRPKENGRYELISGHRRKYACQCLGLEQIPVIACNFDQEEATIAMVDSNLQRERILPSEKAVAYRMKLEALKHQGKRTDATCTPMEHKLVGSKTQEIVAEQYGESREQIRRYVRLTYLIQELLKLVDDDKLGFRPAVELSYLTEEEQWYLSELIESEKRIPTLSQALRMKRHSKDGMLDLIGFFTF